MQTRNRPAATSATTGTRRLPSQRGRRTRAPLAVHIVTVQRDTRDHKHADIARSLHAQCAATGADVQLTVAGSDQEVLDALGQPGEIIVVCGHSSWSSDNEWCGLLGVRLEDLTGIIHARAVVFASCFLYEQADVTKLLAKPTPAVLCDGWARFDRTPIIVGRLLSRLVGAPRMPWSARVESALVEALAEARRVNPRADWARWKFRSL